MIEERLHAILRIGLKPRRNGLFLPLTYYVGWKQMLLQEIRLYRTANNCAVCKRPYCAPVRNEASWAEVALPTQSRPPASITGTDRTPFALIKAG